MKVLWPISSIFLGFVFSTGMMEVSKPANAAFPGTNGNIVYAIVQSEATWSSEKGIYIISKDGANSQRLVDNSDKSRYNPSNPTWSPNGTQLAFDAYNMSLRKRFIWVMDPNGNHQTRLFEGENPTWSPDGTQIAFTRYANITSSQIYIANVDGSGIRQVTFDRYNTQPAWSPDGTQLAFVRSNSLNSISSIFKVNVDGSGLQQLTYDQQSSNSPNWSPDGTQIVFDRLYRPDSEGSIVVMNANGSNQQRLTVGAEVYYAVTPGWSPDGKEIIFTCGGELCAKNLNSKQLTTISIDAPSPRVPDWQPLP
jgi:TolB protein